MINIKNLREGYPKKVTDVRVDRASALGNPFRMANESERNKVCDLYKEWFNTQIETGNKLVINELNRLYFLYKEYGELNLYCWCYPKRCHAEVIKEYLEWLLG